MSSGTNNELGSLDELVSRLDVVRFTYKGNPLGQSSAPTSDNFDRETWIATMICWYLVCLDSRYLNRVDEEWLLSIASCDIFDVAYALKQCDSLFLRYLEGKVEYDWEEFKQLPELTSSLVGNHPSRILEIVYRPLNSLLSLHGLSAILDHGIFRCVHQYCAFISHVSLKAITTDGEWEKYVEVDKAVLTSIPAFAGELKSILTRWLRGFACVHLPHHSSGATADGVFGAPGNHSLFAKTCVLHTDPVLEECVAKHALWSINWDEILKSLPFRIPRYQHMLRQCVLRFVPKTILGPRTISMEPTTLMFFQQAVKDSLYAFIGRHPFLKRRIPLSDQTVNKELARLGSSDGSYATIDLSHASDSVSWTLVRFIFSDTTLMPWLEATRSTSVWYKSGGFEDVRVLAKFANMGSALTFPVESLVFASVCQLACQRHGYRANWSVYGDDIVIDSGLFADVCSMLRELGFTINEDKTFSLVYPSAFRESCGGEYLNGNDVAPLRLSRKFSGSLLSGVISPDVVDSWRELANRSLALAYLRLHRWVVHRLMLLPPDKRPFHGNLPGCINTRGEVFPYLNRPIRSPARVPSSWPVLNWSNLALGPAVLRRDLRDQGCLYSFTGRGDLVISFQKYRVTLKLRNVCRNSDRFFYDEVRLWSWFMMGERLDAMKHSQGFLGKVPPELYPFMDSGSLCGQLEGDLLDLPRICSIGHLDAARFIPRWRVPWPEPL